MREHIETLLIALRDALENLTARRLRPRHARSTFVPPRIEARAGRLAH